MKKNQKTARKIQPAVEQELGSKYSSPAVTWVTAENTSDSDDVSVASVMKNVEFILDKMGMLGAYNEAVKIAGGKSCPCSEKLKIAGYVYFGGAGQDRGFIKKPMSIMKEKEKTDKVRNVGIKKWGDVKIKPLRRPLITEQTYNEWRKSLYPVPKATAEKAEHFKNLCLDDRIKWSHLYLSRYHSLLARSDNQESAVLRSMEYACKGVNLPVFVGEYRNPPLISFLVEEYAGLATSSEVLGSLKELESPACPADIKHDAKIKTLSGHEQSIRLLTPTLKAMNLYSLYSEYVSVVKGASKDGTISNDDRMRLAKYLIMHNPYSESGRGMIVSEIPECLVNAVDSMVAAETAKANDVPPRPSSVERISSPSLGWDRVKGVTAKRIPGSLTMDNIDVMVNGKPKFKMLVKEGATVEEIESAAGGKLAVMAADSLKHPFRKVIVVPGKMVNFVTGERPSAKKVQKKS